MTWIDDEEKHHRKRRESKKQEEESQRHRAEVIRTGGRPLLDKLVEVVARDVKNYSEGCKDDLERRVDFNRKPSGGFKLGKLHYPSGSVDCSLDADHGQIRAKCSFRRDKASAPKYVDQQLELDVVNGDIAIKNPDGEVCTLDDASRLLIQRVLFGTG